MNIESCQTPVDFDQYADRYENILRQQLAFFGGERSYFSAYKVEIASRLCAQPPISVLDFGCGIGLSLPHIRAAFSKSMVFATDISAKSLDLVRKNYPGVVALADDELRGHAFDLVFVSGVFHHIPLAARRSVVTRLSRLLGRAGLLCVFDHNPYNPVTRHLVSTCPFDADAELLTKTEMQRLLTAQNELEIHRSGYCLFFPQSFSWLRPLETSMTWLPAGGQYFVAARRSHGLV